jgi:hypothetical protein
MKNVLPIVLSLFLSMGIALADDSEFRLLVSQNDGTVGGEYQVTAQIKITDGQPSPKVVNSLTLDVPHGATLTAPADTAAQSWFVEDASIDGYEVSVSKLDGYYRLLVTSNDVTAGTGWQITNSAWSDIVTLRWVIGSVLPHDVTLTNTTDAAAYYTGTTGDSDAMDWATTPKQGEELKIAAKVFLRGAFDTGTGAMNTTLSNTSPQAIPTNAPYDDKSVTSIPTNITDWVKLEIRSQETGPAVNFVSVLLDENGNIVADDGSTPEFLMDSPEGAKNYYFVVHHRNHLPVMTSSTIGLSASSVTQYDFTTGVGQAYGTNALADLKGDGSVFGMFAGDANASDGVNSTDYLAVKNEINTSGYQMGDVNLSGLVNSTDYLIVKPNIGNNSQVPN